LHSEIFLVPHIDSTVSLAHGFLFIISQETKCNHITRGIYIYIYIYIYEMCLVGNNCSLLLGFKTFFYKWMIGLSNLLLYTSLISSTFVLFPFNLYQLIITCNNLFNMHKTKLHKIFLRVKLSSDNLIKSWNLVCEKSKHDWEW